jgi:hypothetical protein
VDAYVQGFKYLKPIVPVPQTDYEGDRQREEIFDEFGSMDKGPRDQRRREREIKFPARTEITP